MTMSRREFSVLMASVGAALAAPRVQAAPPRVRREIRSISSAQLDAWRAGITEMKALPTLDFKSWMYQAGVHYATLGETAPIPDGATYWRQCQHGTSHFLTWHRWYLLFAEEILRTLSGTCDFTLPYWDYLADGFLPEPLRVPADASNVLYDDTRHPSLNAGTHGLSGLNTEALDQIDWEDFSVNAGSIRYNPHNSVHNQFGGESNMGQVYSAARDPAFWLHHANIDRLWECWIRQGNGRAHPGSPWRDQTFPFHTLTGTRNAVVADGLRTADLGYTYDSFPCPMSLVWKLPDWVRALRFEKITWRKPPLPDSPPWRALLETGPFVIDSKPSAIALGRADFEKAGGASASRVALILDGVERLPNNGGAASFVEICLAADAKRTQAGDMRDVRIIDSFGTFDLSVVAGHAEHHGGTRSLIIEFPLQARKVLASAAAEMALVFVERSLVSREGRPLNADKQVPLFGVSTMRIAIQP